MRTATARTRLRVTITESVIVRYDMDKQPDLLARLVPTAAAAKLWRAVIGVCLVFGLLAAANTLWIIGTDLHARAVLASDPRRAYVHRRRKFGWSGSRQPWHALLGAIRRALGNQTCGATRVAPVPVGFDW